jgi:glycogen operon protein
MVRLEQAREALRLAPFLKANYRISKETPRSAKNTFFTGEVNRRGLKDVSWHGTMLNCPGWGDSQARALGFTLTGFEDDPDIH